jgi:hypothetical protein
MVRLLIMAETREQRKPIYVNVGKLKGEEEA